MSIFECLEVFGHDEVALHAEFIQRLKEDIQVRLINFELLKPPVDVEFA